MTNLDSSILSPSDRAALRRVEQILDGDYDRDIEIEAIDRGLEIDHFIVIPWEWILAAHRQISGQKNPQTTCPDGH